MNIPVSTDVSLQRNLVEQRILRQPNGRRPPSEIFDGGPDRRMWYPTAWDTTQWYQIDAGLRSIIRGVIRQGHGDRNNQNAAVTSYKVFVSADEVVWSPVHNGEDHSPRFSTAIMGAMQGTAGGLFSDERWA